MSRLPSPRTGGDRAGAARHADNFHAVRREITPGGRGGADVEGTPRSSAASRSQAARGPPVALGFNRSFFFFFSSLHLNDTLWRFELALSGSRSSPFFFFLPLFRVWLRTRRPAAGRSTPRGAPPVHAPCARQRGARKTGSTRRPEREGSGSSRTRGSLKKQHFHGF